jgi:hypothetical protein
MNKLKEIFNAESSINKETRQNYDLIKNNYTDIKNQYDLLNIKYQTLSDENFNYKRDKILYEKELKTKNQMIQELLGNTTALKKREFQNKINEYKNNDAKKVDYLKQINYTSENKFNDIEEENDEEEQEFNDGGADGPIQSQSNNGRKTMDNKENSKNEESQNFKKEVKYNKYEGLNDEELKKIRDKLLVERNDTTNLYNKIPIKINKIEHIKRRDELEKKLAQINSDLVQIRLKLKGNI